MLVKHYGAAPEQSAARRGCQAPLPAFVDILSVSNGSDRHDAFRLIDERDDTPIADPQSPAAFQTVSKRLPIGDGIHCETRIDGATDDGRHACRQIGNIAGYDAFEIFDPIDAHPSFRCQASSSE